jgi:hypothetical protein
MAIPLRRSLAAGMVKAKAGERGVYMHSARVQPTAPKIPNPNVEHPEKLETSSFKRNASFGIWEIGIFLELGCWTLGFPSQQLQPR